MATRRLHDLNPHLHTLEQLINPAQWNHLLIILSSIPYVTFETIISTISIITLTKLVIGDLSNERS